MTAIALVSVINHYHINGLHLFSNTLKYHCCYLTRKALALKDPLKAGGCPRGVMVKAMVCGIVVREFVLQSPYYVHFRANALGERYKPPYPPINRLNNTPSVLLGEWLWH